MSDDDDYGSPEVIPIGSGVRQHTPSHRKGPRFSWTPAYEATFFHSLCESVKLGLKDNHSFKQEAWDRAIQALADRHNAYPNKAHLINKSDNARKKFRLWRGLREDPEFLYNPITRTVTANEEAWSAHIEREPLSKSLRNRPFEHEEYMEILFPDVVGSGGAPKRITKPRRKGAEMMVEGDELDDTPGTNVLQLLGADSSLFQSTPTQTPIQPPTLPSNGTIRPASTTLPARTSVASSSALTPPDELPTEPSQNGPSRKRFLPSNNGAGPPDKRRRTGNTNYMDVTHSNAIANAETSFHLGSNGATTLHQQQATQSAQNTPNGGGLSSSTRTQQFQDAMIAIADQLRTQRPNPPHPSAPSWPQQAMDLFFTHFGDEEMDLQIKIGEKVLCDNNKALMFCMMPEDLRKHWVKRLRELHHGVRGDANVNLGPGPSQDPARMMPVPGNAPMAGMQMGPMGNNPMMRNGSQIG